MYCPVCLEKMVKAKATNFGEEYDYCRSCKKELKELSAPSFQDVRAPILKEPIIHNFKVGERVKLVNSPGIFEIMYFYSDEVKLSIIATPYFVTDKIINLRKYPG